MVSSTRHLDSLVCKQLIIKAVVHPKLLSQRNQIIPYFTTTTSQKTCWNVTGIGVISTRLSRFSVWVRFTVRFVLFGDTS